MPPRAKDIDVDLQLHKKEDQAIHEVVRAACSDIKSIKENHLAHVQQYIGQIQTDILWLKWGACLIIGLILASFWK